ncbi:MAG: hypothetical protein LC650_01540 [Actinobacteria bacterium]|nr:hypothetical protein [Actinomycetota bacterium]
MATVSESAFQDPPRARLVIDNVAAATDFLRIYRSASDEPEFILAETDATTFYDYTVRNGIEYTYRVLEVDGTTESGEATATIDVSIADWWIIDVEEPEDSIEVFVDGSSSLDIESSEDQAAFTPLGRKYPLVIKDQQVKGDVFRVMIQLIGAEVTAFRKLREKQKILLMQSPLPGRQWFFVFGSRVQEQILNVVDDYRLVTFEVVEVDRPALVPYQ